MPYGINVMKKKNKAELEKLGMLGWGHHYIFQKKDPPIKRHLNRNLKEVRVWPKPPELSWISVQHIKISEAGAWRAS